MSSEEITTISMDVADAVFMHDDPTVYTDKIQIHVEGRKYKTQFTKKFLERKVWKEPNPNEILSIIPGSIDSILVKKGDKVKKGDVLMVYVAMKMKNLILAPFDATVESINAKPGEKLPKGSLLLVLSKDDPKVKKGKK